MEEISKVHLNYRRTTSWSGRLRRTLSLGRSAANKPKETQKEMCEVKNLSSGVFIARVCVISIVAFTLIGGSLRAQLEIDTGIPQDDSLRIIEGGLLIRSPFEEAIRMKRVDLTPFNPTFALGRMVIAGDRSPEFRVIYSDDISPERSVFEFDNKGIVASVKEPGKPGSHFEGFFAGDAEPLFRLNSFPAMQLEFGPGGSSPTDVAIRRVAAGTIGFLTGGSERVRIDAQGYLRLETGSSAPPISDCDEASERGRLKVDSANNLLYVCVDSGWMSLGGGMLLGGHQ